MKALIEALEQVGTKKAQMTKAKGRSSETLLD